MLRQAMSCCTRSLRHVGIMGCRGSATGAKSKKDGKGRASDAPKASVLTTEMKSTAVFGTNVLKDGNDPKILPDAGYLDWLWHLLVKWPPLSELRRKNIETLPCEDLKRFVKLDDRACIKENNAVRAKN